MTLLGAFFIPITIVCFLWSPGRLLPLLILASVFEASSVFNGSIGTFVFGVSPFYLVEICVALRFLLFVWRDGKCLPPAGTSARAIAMLLLVFLGWSFLSAMVMPKLFTGIPVYAPREMEDMDMVSANLVPLRWTLSNFAQGLYLALNVAAVLFAFHDVKTKYDAEKLSKAVRWAVFIVVLVGAFQQCAASVGWSYPYSAINNNPNNPFDFHPLDQQVNGFLRISSTLAGPVYAGSFLAAAASGLLASYLRGRRGVRRVLALAAVVAMLFVTASTTGYLAIAFMLFLLTIYYSPFRRRESRERPSFMKGWAVVTLSALTIIVMATSLTPGLSEAVAAMTVDKSEGISFASRVVADLGAFAIFQDTYGLGAGLGSSRHSSLITTLLCTVGLIGTTVFAMLVYRVIKIFPGKWASSMAQMSFWSFLGLLVAQSIAVPDINRPVFWALLLVVLAQSNVCRIEESKCVKLATGHHATSTTA